MLTVTLLGCGGTMPLPQRALSACMVTANGVNILFDCGEGTQTACRRWHVSLYKIGYICLTHYHGDHIFGLPGLLQSMANLGRTQPVTVFGPQGLQQAMGLLLALCGPLPFEVRLCEVPAGAPDAAKTAAPLLRTELPGTGVRIVAFAAQHRTPCLGYRLELPRAGRFDAAAARSLGVPQQDWKRLQRGETVPGAGGAPVQPAQVLGPERAGLAVVFCTDTRPCPALEQAAQGADLLICDATYADPAQQGKARQFGHSTFAESAALAARAGVRRLWLSHYSAALEDPAQALPAAQAVFAAAEAGCDGKRLELRFDQREAAAETTM